MREDDRGLASEAWIEEFGKGRSITEHASAKIVVDEHKTFVTERSVTVPLPDVRYEACRDVIRR